MNIIPIDDNNSDFSKVYLHTNNSTIKPTPHCMKHGAMNKVSIFKDSKVSGIWRCCTSDGVNCRTGCVQLDD